LLQATHGGIDSFDHPTQPGTRDIDSKRINKVLATQISGPDRRRRLGLEQRHNSDQPKRQDEAIEKATCHFN
jgi:hypothetical protein